jgi:hypothetical protein
MRFFYNHLTFFRFVLFLLFSVVISFFARNVFAVTFDDVPDLSSISATGYVLDTETGFGLSLPINVNGNEYTDVVCFRGVTQPDYPYCLFSCNTDIEADYKYAYYFSHWRIGALSSPCQPLQIAKTAVDNQWYVYSSSTGYASDWFASDFDFETELLTTKAVYNSTYTEILYEAGLNTGDSDPLSEIEYGGTSNHYLEYYSPKPSTGYLSEDESYIDITVYPDSAFSTYFYAEYNPDDEQNYIVIDTCDSDWDNCTWTMTEIDDYITAQSDNHLVIPFNVVDDVSGYYKVTLRNYDNSQRSTIPIKITGDLDSTYTSITPYIADSSETSEDLGVFGNLVRKLFIPDSDYFTEKINEVNVLRLEKFAFYYTVKNGLTSSINSVDSSTMTPTISSISIYGSTPVEFFDPTLISSQIEGLRIVLAGAIWLAFFFWLFFVVSTILKS